MSKPDFRALQAELAERLDELILAENNKFVQLTKMFARDRDEAATYMKLRIALIDAKYYAGVIARMEEEDNNARTPGSNTRTIGEPTETSSD